MAREEGIREQMALVVVETRENRTHRWLQNELFGSSNATNSSNIGDLNLDDGAGDIHSPWKFQTQHAKFILKRESTANLQVDILHNEREHERAIQATFPAALVRFGSEIRAAFGSVHRSQSLSSKRLQEDQQQQDQTMAAVLIVENQRSISPDAVNWLTTLISAHRQLTLSPYIQQFLGSKALVSTDCRGHDHLFGEKTFYCFEYLPVSLLHQYARQYIH